MLAGKAIPVDSSVKYGKNTRDDSFYLYLYLRMIGFQAIYPAPAIHSSGEISNNLPHTSYRTMQGRPTAPAIRARFPVCTIANVNIIMAIPGDFTIC